MAGDSSDQKLLAAARQNLSHEKWQVAEEERLRVEEERRRAEQERIALAEQRRQQEAARESSSFQWSKLAAIGVGAAIGGLGNLTSEQQTQFITSAIKDSQAGQEGMSNMQSTTDRLSAEQSQRQAMVAQQERQRQANAMAAEAANNERLLKAARDSRQSNGGQQTVSRTSGDLARQQWLAEEGYRKAQEEKRLRDAEERRLMAEEEQRSRQGRSQPVSESLGRTNHGVPCGADKRCTLGMSGMRSCEPSIPPTGDHCEEGCTIRGWGAAYHDVTLPSDKAYIPTGKLCEAGCTVPNLCSGS